MKAQNNQRKTQEKETLRFEYILNFVEGKDRV